MHSKDYFCYEIYKNIAIWSKDGKIGYNPCSFYEGYIKESDHLDLNDVWHQAEHKQIMMLVETDTPVPGCSSCYRAEAAGLESRRTGAKQLYEEYHNDTNIDLSSPQGLDYSVGNLCNLKCMICGPSNSTAWVPDYQILHPGARIANYNKNYQLKLTRPELLQNIKSIHFHGGGEPLLSDTHYELLLKVKEVKGLSDVRVFYNTNGTVKVSDKVLALWEECKLIELYFSIDDVGNRFEYQRTGASWNQVQSNINWYKDIMPHNHMFNINCAWGYLNLYHLDELVDWYRNCMTTNRYGDPTNLIFQKVSGEFAINKVSHNTYNALVSKFQQYPELLALVNTLDVVDFPDHSTFWKYVNMIDSIRGNDFNSLYPEWSKLL
jgi:hypothetical protein